MLKGVEVAENAGIATISLFLIGLPGDTLANIQETHWQRVRSRIKAMGTNIAWILPNTDIYRKAKTFGFDDNVYLESGAPITLMSSQ